jgi:hypothetical protein
MDSIDLLPAIPLSPGGPVCQAMLEQGWTTIRQAACAIKAMPYGYNPNPLSVLSLLVDGYGTCTTKHALLAAAAEELGLTLHKVLGAYCLDGSVVQGADAILARAGLTAVPAMHCFLSYGLYRIDLTEGNCNGKNVPLDSYFYLEACDPLPPAAVEQAIYQRALERFIIIYAPGRDPELLTMIKDRCVEQMQSLLACGRASVKVS